jgi:DNA-3-methyladenine glycosylase II
MTKNRRSTSAVAVEDIEKELTRADPKLGRLINAVVVRAGIQRPLVSKASPFQALVRAVVYQSVAAKAAAVIYKRLQECAQGPLTPRKVIKLRESRLLNAGLSSAKAHTIHALAKWFIGNRFAVKNLPELPDETVTEILTAIPGIGVWTVNVFLIFNLRRLDVMPTGDLGIRRGVQLIDGLRELPGPKQVHERALRWRPYRSIASMYLWRVVRLKLTADDLKNASTLNLKERSRDHRAPSQ